MVFRRILELLNRPDPSDPRRLAGMGMGRTFSELAADPNDFNVANGFFGLIDGPHHGEFNATFFRPIEQPIMLTWHANGIIGNGGFAYLFEAEWPGDPDYELTMEAHRQLGCDSQFEAFRLALNAVADSPSRDSRSDTFLELPSGQQNNINSLYRGDAGTPERQIAAYVRRNVKRLGHLRGRIS
ncbi:DMP19 family protein [Allorhodopirellula solitaria]|uniref:DNA mimic protein DMP19 C-terminal domain-containing protein n=1 Tax=Allorhodopirellula solitaria TaxID=2527987 RepID=A0A5C5YJE4_9BACT|nr:hypothetical protein [Allorhodopirellula solitaria]TWT75002.1 hypothetical protein CA85_02900 [Allorhodopirellula solitaria]